MRTLGVDCDIHGGLATLKRILRIPNQNGRAK
jgi:hypothetical protein